MLTVEVAVFLCVVVSVCGLQQPALAVAPLTASDPSFQNIYRGVVDYVDGDVTLKGFIAQSRLAFSAQRPAVLVVPDWNGRDDYENRRALQLAQLGYIGFAVDVYGNGTIGQSTDENQRLMAPFLQNRPLFLSRLQAALRFLRSNSIYVDNTKVAAIGYCFGGLGVLDMARAGLPLLGVVSFHGNLSPPPSSFRRGTISAKVLVQTGYDDPSVPPDLVNKFEEEMKGEKADWQLIAYGNTVHSFTVPGANMPGQAQYNRLSDQRSWAAMKNFFREIFNEE